VHSGIEIFPWKVRVMLNLGILVSGKGSDLQSIIDSIGTGYLTEAKIAVVISNKADAFALERARNQGIPAVFIEFRKKPRLDFDKEMIEVLKKYKVDLVVMAGFMRLVTQEFVSVFKGRIINIHPALLPSFPGTHGHRDALAWGVKVSGCTVHFLDEQMDHGPIIMQHAVEVMNDDTEETLSQRILVHEHNLLPKAIKLYARGSLEVKDRKVIIKEDLPGFMDSQALKHLESND
jgi:phosphoribosylglycinamide formyltransferase-1